MQLGIDGLGRQKHQRAIGGFAFNQVLFRNRLDVDADGGAQGLGRLVQLILGLGAAQGLIGLQREFTVDHNRAGRVRQMDQTIRALAVRQGDLHRIAVRGQGLGHNVVQLNLTERAAGLFVR